MVLVGSMHKEVYFDEEQWNEAVDFAMEMDEDSRKKNRKNNFGIKKEEDTPEENFRKTLQGAVAECAVHIVTGEEWHKEVGNVGKKKTLPDLGEDIQVRSRKRGNPLIHRPTDDKEQKFVLVWVNLAERSATIVGWLYGWECREKGRWSDPQGRNNFIWQTSSMALRPIDSI